ncbi:hypothetical protein BGX29_009005 [Mortierella sp. GBA35]|nr:hypothetical protein BGX23_004523 [Mortierella sp. AD031]KAF9106603.1 hypothetical protein BGX29_009005 [Mortierella sp. GBA35]KAG0211125.1 hypothetical protein BGX33_004513 [Mortierella sp. NVP41]
MGNSASKSNAVSTGAKSAARHFPSASAIQEKAAATGSSAKLNATAGSAAARSAAGMTGGSSPKQDYLEQQRRLEEEIARYDLELKKSGKLDGESRPVEDTPSAAERQFFGNLNAIGQVDVHNPDQIKHREAEAILKRKLPSKTPSSSSTPYPSGINTNNNNTSTFAQSSPLFAQTSASTAARAAQSGSNLTSLKLMQLLQLRNQDPSFWTESQLSEEFRLKVQDIRSLTQYINTYSILPGKDAKGREAGVWCEDLRGVEVLDKPSSVADAEAEQAERGGSGSGRSSLLSDSLADAGAAAGAGTGPGARAKGSKQTSHGGRK